MSTNEDLNHKIQLSYSKLGKNLSTISSHWRSFLSDLHHAKTKRTERILRNSESIPEFIERFSITGGESISAGGQASSCSHQNCSHRSKT
ncbi:unnamed protein product [Hermetia illucens]|uniref:Uncharacterized protein n=1 Tax=Hermetia illucens TaxID=343691 RepID=A0A7R8UTZ6_HERIL|nr:unnamed protein product [Hermetia illucens]